jgi:transcriptional regulator with XRE-family HTH domain
MNIKKNLGKKIQEFRKRQNLTQDKLSEILGIDIVSLSKIETGRNYPTSENLTKIALVLNVQPEELFEFNDLTNEEMFEEIFKRISLIKDDKKKLEKVFKIIKVLT